MTADAWILLGVSIVLVPSVTWLIREVLALRVKVTEIETRLAATDRECKRHQEWAGQLQACVVRVDKNVGRLCVHAGVAEVQ
jgi:hypothetical protein